MLGQSYRGRATVWALVIASSIGMIACRSSGDDSNNEGSSTDASLGDSAPNDENGRDPALDEVDVCLATGQVSATLGQDTGSENMTGEDYATWAPQMVSALDDLLAVDPPDDIGRAAEEFKALFESFVESLDEAPRGPDADYPADEAAVAALEDSFPDENRFFELGDLVAGSELNCS